jgi:alcohol dehydrogenase (cytochrome c)
MRGPCLVSYLLLAAPLCAQPPAAEPRPAGPGQRLYDNNCSVCHGADGGGGELAPSILFRLSSRSDAEIAGLIHSGIPDRGMPAFNLGAQETNDLVAYLRTFRPPRMGFAPVRKKIETTEGQTIEGTMIGESSLDLSLRTDDGKIHLFRTTSNGRYRPVTSQTDWPTYNGQVGGNRFTNLAQITPENIGKLSLQWVFTLSNAPTLETTPVVVNGIMYATSGNECYALDAGNGRMLWHFQRARTRGLVGNAAGGFNRGVAQAGDRIFMVTDNAHILALNRYSGKVEWETEMADSRLNYNATSAPLAVGNLVVSGTAGGEQGARGFIAAYNQSDGKEVWRFWTVPLPGEPGSETWKGKAIEHPSAVAWFTGTYDAELDTLYWPTGNPGPDFNDDERGGDNLYSCSVIALDAKSGKMKWYYQFTPHDTWDWDAAETPMLVDANWRGEPRKLLLQGNRNGFFYVLDRVSGKLLSATPLVKNLNWALGIGEDQRPKLNPAIHSDTKGAKVCPPFDGGTNWYAPSYNAGLGLFFVQTMEGCSLVTKRDAEWQAGRGYMGGSARPAPGETRQKVLRAIDLQTGKFVWELPETGRGDSWGGTLATATGLVFLCDDSGTFMAVGAKAGKVLWQFPINQLWKASPMTYQFDGKEYIAVAAGQNILAFGLIQ